MIHVLIIAVIDGVPMQAPFVNKKFSEQILSFAVISFLSSIYTFLMRLC